MISTARLVLRPFTLADVPKLFAMSHEAGLRRFIPDQVYRDESHAGEVARALIAFTDAPPDPRVRPYVLGVEHAGELVGHVGLSAARGSVEIGYAIEDRLQGQGFATEAVRGMADFAFRALGLPEVLGVVAADNRSSRRVLEKAGFVPDAEHPSATQLVYRRLATFVYLGSMRHWWGGLLFVAACSGGVTAKASFLNGAGGNGTRARIAGATAIPAGVPVIASPDKVTVTFTKLSLQSGQTNSSDADLSDCVVTFDRSQASGSHSLDCEFAVDPGTYDTIRISYKATLKVLIDDPTNNYYSDPTSPNLLSTARPPNGAQEVDYVQGSPGGGGDPGFGIPLYPPVEITADSTAFSLIGDLNRTIQIGDGNNPPTLTNPNHQIGEAVNIVAVPGASGSAEFYQDTATYVPTGDNTSKGLKVFYGPNGQPVTTIMPPNICGWPGLDFGYQFGPSAVAMQSGTMFLYGAYLGMDSNKTISWEEPSLQGWSAGAGLFEIKRAGALGEMQTLQFQAITNTPPASGDTFASGAPAITPSATLPLYLHAQ